MSKARTISELEKLKVIIERYFPGKSEIIQILLATAASLAVKGAQKTIPLFLVGPASSGKSICLSIIGGGLEENPGSCFVDNMTAKSWISARETDEGVDLLEALLESPVLITSELNVLFRKPPGQLDELLGIITRIVDSEGFHYYSSKKLSGNRGQNYHFVWVGATIRTDEKVNKKFSLQLGPRFYYLQMRQPVESTAVVAVNLVRMLQDQDFNAKISICQHAVKAFIQSIHFHRDTVEWGSDNPEYLHVLSNCAILLKPLRAGLEIFKDKGAKNVRYAITPESPERANAILYNLARGLAVLERYNVIQKKHLAQIVRVVIDTAAATYPIRTELFLQMVKNNGNLKLDKFVYNSKYSRSFALEEFQKLEALGLIDISKDSTIRFSKEYQEPVLVLGQYLGE